MLKFLIVDDHAITRKGLTQILQEEFPSAQVSEAMDAAEMVNKIHKQEWDLIISDLSMPGKSGFDVLNEVHRDFPLLPVLILSFYPEEQNAIPVLRAGAAGYLNKEVAAEELIIAVRRILLGRKYISPAIAEKMAVSLHWGSNKKPHELLSDREMEVMKLLSSGNSVTDIAKILNLSTTTISTFRARILLKMSLKTNADLTLYVARLKL